MKIRTGRATLRRRRRATRGFTLIELMVVVVLVSILAVLAIPNMQAAREDRLAFRTADQFARIIHDAQTHAQGRGAAQLVLLTADGTADRGKVLSFEALGAAGRPVSACREVGQWLGVPASSVTHPYTDGANANGAAGTVQFTAGLESTIQVSGTTKKAAAICFTPGGRVYVTQDDDPLVAVAAIAAAPAFTGDLVMTVVRKPGGGVANGLAREVIMTAAGGTRVHSR